MLQATEAGDSMLNLPFVQVHTLQDVATGQCWQLSQSDTSTNSENPARRLLVLLDGNLTTIPAALMQQSRAERGIDRAPPCTVVGVGYPNALFYDRERRARDFLPSLPPGLDPAVWQSGQADGFSNYLESQLLPWLEARNGAPFSEIGLFGHSYGGLFSLYKLLHRPGRFTAFFSISPSLWWANGWLLEQLSGATQHCASRTLYLGIGADERAMPGDDAQRVKLHHERDVQGRFAQLVATLQSQNISLQAETFAGEDHGSVVYPALTRAVRWLMRPTTRDTPHATDKAPP